MTYLPIGRRRSLSLGLRAGMVVAQFWQDWRRARSRARTARLLRDCDDHLLRDMGLTREGTRDPEIWNAETWNPWR